MILVLKKIFSLREREREETNQGITEKRKKHGKVMLSFYFPTK